MTRLTRPASGAAFSTFRGNGVHVSALAFALTAVVCLVLVALAELGSRIALPLQWDELWFLTCVARGEVAGAVPAVGCHDNKGPVIYLAYQALLMGADVYDPVRLKLAAFGVAFVICLLAGGLAYRRGGALGAYLAGGLLLLQLGAVPALLALKTESVGMVFILLALWVLDGSDRVSSLRGVCVGALFGLAILAKQVFVLPLLSVLFALLCWPNGRAAFNEQRAAAGSRLSQFVARLKPAFMVGLGALLPLLIYLVWVWHLGLLDPALQSLVLHVLLYGNPEAMSPLQRWAWRFGSLGLTLLAVLPLALLSVWKMVAAAGRSAGVAELPGGLRSAWVGTVFIALFTPLLTTAHLLPFLVLAAPLGGVLLAELVRHLSAQRNVVAGAMAGLLLYAACVVLAAWFGPNAREKTGASFYRFEKVNTTGAHFGYVVGQWPEFYTHNRLVPASSVMYPTALPGAPESWMFKPLDPQTLKGRWASAAFERNANALLEDFAATPPRYIHVANAMARSKGTKAATNVPVLASYIARHCVMLRELEGAIQHAGTVYECANGR